MSKSNKIKTIAIYQALPGTRVIIFDPIYFTTVPPADAPVVQRTEKTIISWIIREREYRDEDQRIQWAEAVCSDPVDLDESPCVIVYPDGTMDFKYISGRVPEATTIEGFAKGIEKIAREDLMKLKCMDCEKVAHMGSESPILEDDIWESIVPGGAGRLCREHMELRLGHVLTPDDLKDLPVNSYAIKVLMQEAETRLNETKKPDLRVLQ